VRQEIVLNDEEEVKIKARTSKLATEKAYLQLIIELMNRLSTTPGLENTVQGMLSCVSECIGGTGVSIYFLIDDALYKSSLFEGKKKIAQADDALVIEVFERREPLMIEHEFGNTLMKGPAFTKAWTWVFPLNVGHEIIGVFKIENLHIAIKEMKLVLPTFFTFAALVLKNEIQGQTRLQRAYDALAAANADLTAARQELELRVQERTEAAKALTVSNEELAEANQQLEAFSYSVSHDLRTPLRAIEGFSEILVSEYKEYLDNDGNKYLGIVRKNAQRMGRLIEDLLAFSRASRRDVDAEDVNLKDLALEVFDELCEMEPECRTKLELGDIPNGRCDKGMMRQALVNLINNAIKFSKKNSEPLVTIGGYGDKAENVYFVRDNGAGFDMKHVDKLFGVFQRLHSNEEFEGTGIGLAIVKRVIARHGGRVWAEGKVGEGATLYFTLPA
jgi:signal transduction histidine kinase